MDEAIIRNFSRRLHALTLAADKESDGYHKSYDGDMIIEYRINGPFSDAKEEWNIHIASYLLCDGRSIDFIRPTLEQCLVMLDGWLYQKEKKYNIIEPIDIETLKIIFNPENHGIYMKNFTRRIE